MEGVSPFKVKKSKLPPIQRKSELLADAKKRREERIKRDAEEANEAGKHFRLKFSKGTIGGCEKEKRGTDKKRGGRDQ